MKDFEELMRKAAKLLDESLPSDKHTILLRGIGYAILALARATKDSKKRKRAIIPH